VTRPARRACVATAVALLAALTLPLAAAAQENLGADEIVARSKAAGAADRRPESERETWNVRIAGLDGTLESIRRGSDFVNETDLGPFHTAHGEVRDTKWHQNENGETVLDRPEPSQIDRPLAQNVQRVREPLDAWEIVTTFASGHVQRAYYDTRTFQLVRMERVTAGHESHTTYEDFRTDARGRTRSWHYFGGDDRPDNAFDYRLVRDDTEAVVSDAELAIPPNRRSLVEFPAGDDPVRLPARIVNGRIYVRLLIAGRGLDFLLDTGAAEITIDDGVARQLGLAVYGRSTQTVAGNFATGRVVVPEIAVGPLALHDVVMHTLPFAASEAKAVRVVGLLGFDFLDALGLKIDYANGTLEALRPGTITPPPAATSLEVRLNSSVPVARATIGNATGDDFIIDTGAAFSYVIFQRFARAHPDSLAIGSRESYGNGVGGTFGYRSIETKRVVLGAWSFDDAFGVEALSSNAFGFDNVDGLIGADILKRFTVYLDYAGNRVYLAQTPRSDVEATNARR
jgi:predicted aspartyl protease